MIEGNLFPYGEAGDAHKIHRVVMNKIQEKVPVIVCILSMKLCKAREPYPLTRGVHGAQLKSCSNTCMRPFSLFVKSQSCFEKIPDIILFGTSCRMPGSAPNGTI